MRCGDRLVDGGGGGPTSAQSPQPQHDLDSVSHLVMESKAKVQEIRANLKNLEVTSQRLHAQVS